METLSGELESMFRVWNKIASILFEQQGCEKMSKRNEHWGLGEDGPDASVIYRSFMGGEVINIGSALLRVQ